jgi:hypothetical protein
LEQFADEPELARYALHFRGKLPKDTVEDFVREYLHILSTVNSVAIETPQTVSNHTMDYLWRKYLRDRQFPAVLGTPAVINMIIDLIPKENYDQERRQFIGVSSPYLLTIERFHRFWQDCIIDDCPSDPLNEYEIDEITAMYREWNGGTVRITDSQIMDLIRFYKKAEIVDNKYVQGIRCTLWHKQFELTRFFENLHDILEKSREDEDGLGGPINNTISIYDAYAIYKTKWTLECAEIKRIKMYISKDKIINK